MAGNISKNKKIKWANGPLLRFGDRSHDRHPPSGCREDRERKVVDPVRAVEAAIAPTLEAMGYDLVRVVLGGGKNPTLQIMAERKDGQPMSVDDCADISHAASALLDVEDPIAGSYMLEVSSPGVDRPLTKPADFQRFMGDMARIEMRIPVEGRRRFKGRLMGLTDAGEVRIQTEEGDYILPLTSMDKAKLLGLEETPAGGADRRRKH